MDVNKAPKVSTIVGDANPIGTVTKENEKQKGWTVSIMMGVHWSAVYNNKVTNEINGIEMVLFTLEPKVKANEDV